jgi:hypothetical protein
LYFGRELFCYDYEWFTCLGFIPDGFSCDALSYGTSAVLGSDVVKLAVICLALMGSALICLAVKCSAERSSAMMLSAVMSSAMIV